MFTFGRHLIGDSIEIFKCRQSIVFSFFFRYIWIYSDNHDIACTHEEYSAFFERKKPKWIILKSLQPIASHHFRVWCVRARVCVFVFSHIRFIYVYTYDIANAVPLIAQ